MAIRKWRVEDLPRIVELLGQLAADLGEEFELAPEDARAQFDAMRDEGTYECFVHEERGSILGFVSVLYYRSLFHRKGTGLVNELVVDRGRRGAGIGEGLLRFVVGRIEEGGWDEVEVGVERENRRAIEFYKRNGLDEEYLLLGREFEPRGPGFSSARSRSDRRIP